MIEIMRSKCYRASARTSENCLDLYLNAKYESRAVHEFKSHGNVYYCKTEGSIAKLILIESIPHPDRMVETL